jgi:hypothetical protein
MEKAVIFGPMILFFGFFLILIIAFLGFIFKLIMKSKNEEWTGEVIDKQYNAVRDSEYHNKMNYFYWLVVKTTDGRDRKIGLSQEMWNKFEIGNRLYKPKGKLFPEKVN